MTVDLIDSEQSDAVIVADANQRHQVHRHGFRFRLIHLLKAAYPALAQLLGQEAFAGLVQDFLSAKPNTPLNVLAIGQRLPLHIAVSLDEAEALVELAQYEWTVYQLAQTVPQQILSLDDWRHYSSGHFEELGECRLAFNAASRLMVFKFNTVAMQQAILHRQQATPERLREPKTHLISCRRAAEIACEELSEADIALYDCLQAGIALAAICGQLRPYYQSDEACIRGVSDTLRDWIGKGLFSLAAT